MALGSIALYELTLVDQHLTTHDLNRPKASTVVTKNTRIIKGSNNLLSRTVVHVLFANSFPLTYQYDRCTKVTVTVFMLQNVNIKNC